MSGAIGGTAVLNNNGTPGTTTDDFVRFTPTADLCGVGAGRYDYTVSDGALTDTGRVTVNITCVNDAPVAVADTYPATEDTTLNVAAPGVLGNDSDVDGNPLTAVLVTGPWPPGHPDPERQRQLHVTPAANLTAPPRSPTRPTTGPPTATRSRSRSTWPRSTTRPSRSPTPTTATEDTTLNVAAPGVLGNDSDVDGDR